MKKKTKGLVAGGLGLALLLGTGGTFAMWYQDRAIGSGTIDTGSMTMTVTPTWDPESTVTVGYNHLWVPGDWARATLAADISLVGQNLEAQLAIDGGFANTEPVQFFMLVDGTAVPLEVGESVDLGTTLTPGSPAPALELLIGFPSFRDGFATDSSVPNRALFSEEGSLPTRNKAAAAPGEIFMWATDAMTTPFDLGAVRLTLVQTEADVHTTP